MKCPNCADRTLRPVLTKQGVEVDHCNSCEGVWLERGEIYLFSKKPKPIAAKLKDALEQQRPCAKLSPVSGEAMTEITYPGGLTLEYCPRSGGLWFDAGQLHDLLEGERGLHMAYDRHVKETDRWEGSGKPMLAMGTKLMPLPNLVLRSTATLLGLYGLLTVILISAVEFAGVPAHLAVIAGIVAVALQFLIGPFLMDLSLRWLYRMEWVPKEQLPAHLRLFTERVCAEKKVRFPRFGVIDDGAPQAFTYGYTPKNGRIVVSRGLFELLEPEETEAVVAHEIGHVVHWDMFLMTVVQLVPLLLYYVYRMCFRASSSSDGDSRSRGGAIGVAIIAYILYIISEYVVLWFSRTREYHADRFAGTVTGNPSLLASALVKIAYGLAREEKGSEDETEEGPKRRHNLDTIGALGIFDSGAAQALAIASYSDVGTTDVDRLTGAMRWDLWNPWAKWYELNSTHPLVAKRLLHLSNQATHMGRAPYVEFNLTRPESYWDEFFVDLGVHLMPLLAAIPLLLFGVVRYAAPDAFQNAFEASIFLLPMSVAFFGCALLLRFEFTYRSGFMAPMSVAALLHKVKVSGIRPVPCQISGTVIGRGIPGYMFSEDFVMKDDTGIIFLDYRQPLAIWELLFGLLKAGTFEGKQVTVEGWYRRSPTPYIEIKTIECDGKVRRSWIPALNRFTAILILAGGVGWAAVEWLRLM